LISNKSYNFTLNKKKLFEKIDILIKINKNSVKLVILIWDVVKRDTLHMLTPLDNIYYENPIICLVKFNNTQLVSGCRNSF